MGQFTGNIGTRAFLTFGTSAYEDTFEITSIRFSGMERAAIDASHMGCADPGAAVIGNRIFIPGELINPGQLTVEGNFNANVVPPFFGTPGTGTTAVFLLTVNIPMGSGATQCKWEGSAFLVSMDAEIPMEEMMTATLTFQFTGAIDTDLYATGAALTVTAGN